MKVMSIIGIVWFSLSLVCCMAFSLSPETYLAGIGWGELGLVYALAFAIVALVKSGKQNKALDTDK